MTERNLLDEIQLESRSPGDLPQEGVKTGTFPATAPSSREVFLYDRTDRKRFADFVGKSRKLDTMLEGLENDWGDESYPLLQDTWVWFNRGGAVAKDPEHPSPGNEEILDAATQTGEAKEAARETLDDDVSSALAVLEMQPIYLQLVARLKKDKQAADEAEQKAETAEAKAEANKNRAAKGNAGAKAKQPDLDKAAQDARQKANQAQKALSERASQEKKGVRGKMRAACRKAAKTAQEARDTLESYGAGTESAGGAKRCSPEDLDRRIGLAQSLVNNPVHRRIAELVGKLTRELFHRRASNSSAPPMTINKVGRGEDLGKALPHTLALLGHPSLRYKVLADAGDRALPIYTSEDVPEEVKGAVLCVRDKSGSMECSMAAGYTRDNAATAYSLAVMAIARSEDRPFFAVDFSYKTDLKVWNEAELTTPEGVLAFAHHSFGGGTDMGAALECALEVLKTNPDRLRNADVLMLTDVEGDCEGGSAQKQAIITGLRALEARLWLYDVGPGYQNSYPDLPEIARATDGARFNTQDLLSETGQEALGQVTDRL